MLRKKLVIAGMITALAGSSLSVCEAGAVYGAGDYYDQYEESRIPEAESVSGISAVVEEPETDGADDAAPDRVPEEVSVQDDDPEPADGGNEEALPAETGPEETEAPEENDAAEPEAEAEPVEEAAAEEPAPEEAEMDGQEEGSVPAEYLVTEDVSDLVMQKGAILSEDSLEEGSRVLEVVQTEGDSQGEDSRPADIADVYAVDQEEEIVDGGVEDLQAGLAYTENVRQMDALLRAAIESREESVNLSSCHIKAVNVGTYYARLINDNARYFYVDTEYKYASISGYVTTFYPTYIGDYTAEDSAAFEEKADLALAGVDSGWNDEQKILYIHDWLVTHIEYDYSLSGYNAYNALVEGSAVCQGYTLAFDYLMQRLDIESDFIGSDKLNHCWNMVSAGGSRYFVDTTWDDSRDYRLYCSHENFLVSGKRLYANSHASKDWVDSLGENVSSALTDTSYDGFYWSGSVMPLAIHGQACVYIDSAAPGRICMHDYGTGSDTVLAEIEVPEDYYETCAAVFGDDFIAAGADGICLITGDGTVTPLYRLGGEETAAGMICGITCSGRTVTYYLYNGPEELVTTGEYTISSTDEEPEEDTARVSVSGIRLSNADMGLLIGDEGIITASVAPYNASDRTVQWKSSDENIVTVSEGRVKAKAPGTALVTASTKDGGFTAECRVRVLYPAPSVTLSCTASGQIRIKWSKIDGVDKYAIYGYEEEKDSWRLLKRTEASSVYWNNRVNGTAYRIRVIGLDADLHEISDYAEDGKKITYYDQPANIQASCTEKGIRVTWDEVESAAAYRIYYKTGDGKWTNAGTSFAQEGGTEFMFTDVSAGQTYQFTVAVLDNNTVSSAYDTIGAEAVYLAAAPPVTSVSGSNGGIKIVWGAVTGGSRYRVFYQDGSSWKKIGDTEGTSYTWSGAAAGRTYTFTVRCLNADGSGYGGSYDQKGTAFTYTAAPALTGASCTEKGIQISWAKTAGAAKYRLFRKNGSGWTQIADTADTSYTWTKPVSGTTYTFTVRCISKDGSVYTGGFNTGGRSIKYIKAPAITGLENTKTGIKISWEKPAGAAKYRLFRKSGSGWTKIADTTGASYTWTGAKSGTSYTFTVRCVNSAGTAYTSGYLSAGKTIRFIQAPSISSLTSTSKGVKISWKKVTGAEKYRIYYKYKDTWKKIADSTGTSYTWTGAKSGTTYTFYIRCVSPDGKKITSGVDTKGKTIKYKKP